MPRHIGAFCNATRSHLAVKQNNPHVWISEDILSQTFNAFVQNHQRHGSNVPGPLEARRRASRRRATHLAHSSAGNYNPESFGLFDTRSQQAWWRKEDTTEQNLSSWHWPFEVPLISRGPPPPPRRPQQHTQYDQVEDELIRPGNKSSEAKLKDHLEEVHTHAALVDMLSDLSISLRHTPNLARVILKHIVDMRWEYEEIASYLLDPRTNTSGTSNHAYLLENANKHRDVVAWLLCQGIFAKAARFGLLDVDEIKRIVILIAKVDTSLFPNTQGWASFCVELLDAIEASKVLSLQDIGPEFARFWLHSISRQDFCRSVPELVLRLQRFLGLSHDQALESVVHTSLSMCRGPTTRYLCDMVKLLLSQPSKQLSSLVFNLTYQLVEEAGQIGSSSTTDRREVIDFEVRNKLLREVSSLTDAEAQVMRSAGRQRPLMRRDDLPHGTKPDPSIIASVDANVQERLANPRKLELWYATIAELGYLDDSAWESYIDAFRTFVCSPADEINARQRSISAFWVLMTLQVQKNYNNDKYSEVILAELDRTFSVVGTDSLSNIHHALASSPLPARNKLFRRIFDLGESGFRSRLSFWNLGRLCNVVENAELHKLCHENLYIKVAYHLPAGLIRLAESLNSDMANFESSCTKIIMNSKDHIKIVYRLLWHNTQLRTALRQAGKLMQTSPTRWDNLEPGKAHALGGYSYLKLVDMMHNFAKALSESNQVTPRTAWRRVLVIKKFLRECGAPIKASFARALWHAAITREQQAGRQPTYAAITYFYGQVVEMEGEAAAKNLLHASNLSVIPDLQSNPDFSEFESQSNGSATEIFDTRRTYDDELWTSTESPADSLDVYATPGIQGDLTISGVEPQEPQPSSTVWEVEQPDENEVWTSFSSRGDASELSMPRVIDDSLNIDGTEPHKKGQVAVLREILQSDGDEAWTSFDSHGANSVTRDGLVQRVEFPRLVRRLISAEKQHAKKSATRSRVVTKMPIDLKEHRDESIEGILALIESKAEISARRERLAKTQRILRTASNVRTKGGAQMTRNAKTGVSRWMRPPNTATALGRLRILKILTTPRAIEPLKKAMARVRFEVAKKSRLLETRKTANALKHPRTPVESKSASTSKTQNTAKMLGKAKVLTKPTTAETSKIAMTPRTTKTPKKAKALMKFKPVKTSKTSKIATKLKISKTSRRLKPAKVPKPKTKDITLEFLGGISM